MPCQCKTQVACAPRACPRCARSSDHRSVCLCRARLRARTVCTVYSCSLSSICARSSPCLLRVPMRCVLELCTLVLGVWCTCAAFAQIVRHPLVIIVDIAGVHRPVLCAGAVHACVVVLVSPMLALRVPAVHTLAVHACVMRACTSHARVACTCCACPCCACLRCALSCGVWCACAALIYIVWSSPTLHPRRPWRLAMTFTLSPFSVTYACSCHVIMHCSSLFAPFLAYVVPSFYPIFYCILCSVPCLRLCLRKVAQVSLSAAEHPGHLFPHIFPPHFAPFVPALLSRLLTSRHSCSSARTLWTLSLR